MPSAPKPAIPPPAKAAPRTNPQSAKVAPPSRPPAKAASTQVPLFHDRGSRDANSAPQLPRSWNGHRRRGRGLTERGLGEAGGSHLAAAGAAGLGLGLGGAKPGAAGLGLRGPAKPGGWQAA